MTSAKPSTTSWAKIRQAKKFGSLNLAFVAPEPHVAGVSAMGDYDFMTIYNQSVSSEYISYFKEASASDRVVFMDNGAFERGAPLPDSELMELAKEVRPTVIYTPDYLGDWEATREASITFVKKFRQYDDFDDIITLTVVQGPTLSDMLIAVDELLRAPDRDCGMVALPYHHELDVFAHTKAPRGLRLFAGRQWLFNRVYSILKHYELCQKELVFTGLSNPIETFFAKAYGIWGLDSTSPIVAAKHGLEFNAETGLQKLSGKLDFEEGLTDDEMELVKKNISIMYKYWT